VPTVNPDFIEFDGPLPQVAVVGLPFTVKATATLNGSVDLGYSANISLSNSKDPTAVIPSSIAITNGSGSFTMTAEAVGSGYQRYLASGPGVPFNSQFSISVVPAPKTLQFKLPQRVTEGVPFSVLMSAGSAHGDNIGYTADVTVSSITDPTASIPNPITMTQGSASFTMAASTAAGHDGTTQTYIVSAPAITPDSSFSVQVIRQPQSVQCVCPTAVDAGVPFTVTINVYLNAHDFAPDINYSADVNLSNPNDPNALVPSSISIARGSATFTMAAGAIGSGVQTYSIVGPGLPPGSSFSVNVNPVSAPTFTAQPSSETVAQGQDATFWVSATGFPNYQWNFNGAPIPGATSPTYTVHAASSANVGSYTVEIANTAGSLTSTAATLALSGVSGLAPILSPQPGSLNVGTGRSVVYNVGVGPSGLSLSAITASAVNATSKGPMIAPPSSRVVSSSVSYQWFFNGVALVGETNPTLVVSDVEPWKAGSYTCLVSNAYGSTLSSAGVVTSVSTQDPGRLVNLSTRAMVGTGANQLIEGFVVGGNGTAGGEVLLTRASGPALSQFGVTGLLADPQLAVTGDSGFSDSNSGWAGDPVVETVASQVGAFNWPNGSSLDSALLDGFLPGAYTAQISGATGDTGVALGEIYDATEPGTYSPSSPRLINLSSRAQVGAGSNVLIAGFIVGGTTSETVLIRGSGPALLPLGVPGALPDPQLQLYRNNADHTSTLLQSDAGWGGNAQIAASAAGVGAFSWGSAATPDSAILVTLPPGTYSAQLSGVSGDTGIALVEVYEVP
jgi:hypothetical protein